METTYQIKNFNVGEKYIKFHNIEKNITVIITNIVNKKTNVLLCYEYVSNLINSVKTENLNYLERDGEDSSIQELIYYIYELEIIQKISELFDINEFEKFDNEQLLSLELKNRIINYDIINNKIILEEWKFNNSPPFNIINSTCNKNSLEVKLKICQTNYLKRKLSFYLAHKQNILTDLISQIEQILLGLNVS